MTEKHLQKEKLIKVVWWPILAVSAGFSQFKWLILLDIGYHFP